MKIAVASLCVASWFLALAPTIDNEKRVMPVPNFISAVLGIKR